ncbi:hypothetical protein NDU88_006000 [Pleurodeles waltl]|uniref:Uncharacterized protein n=1 Tax=Pleurodeles waltl TaxID=8319 RepID=A0AAV7TVJ9_PLEWA|nr:hypothetical protein NDU88_006000 [Pleurodeles waltl]
MARGPGCLDEAYRRCGSTTSDPDPAILAERGPTLRRPGTNKGTTDEKASTKGGLPATRRLLDERAESLHGRATKRWAHVVILSEEERSASPRGGQEHKTGSA